MTSTFYVLVHVMSWYILGLCLCPLLSVNVKYRCLDVSHTYTYKCMLHAYCSGGRIRHILYMRRDTHTHIHTHTHTHQNKFLKLMGGKKPGNDAGGR
jgi:pentatricopeptide repeat protein